MGHFLIFTDLDGTLLDHHTYSHAAAAGALEEIRRRGIPLVLSSSKTRAEMLEIQRELGLDDPFICENGAAVFPGSGGGTAALKEFARPRTEVLAVLERLRGEEGFAFSGFNDWTVAEIADRTGLEPAQAALAAEREYSEPLLWGDSESALDRFLQHLDAADLRAQQGGRFLSVSSPCDKGAALQWLRARYAQEGPVTSVALGDSPNDLDMLASADIAVIIRSQRSADMNVHGPRQVIRSEQPGPAGWQEVMGPLLEQENNSG